MLPSSLETELLSRLMSAAALRTRVIAGNLANQNTPGYRRQVVQFEKQLREALAGGDAEIAAVQPTVTEDDLTPTNASGNNVTMELEIGALNENQLLVQSYAAILRVRGEILRASIQSRGIG